MIVIPVGFDDEQEYQDKDEWQITEIKQAIIECGHGDFVSEKELNTLFIKMGVSCLGEV
ncbi:hypothetical protein [Yersinia massiliensis]|uniref:hypothetical protein n=1 Tax=Yersinia massiliensis TaxID=419257 RepID=UPI001643D6EB|nr:hypothetical protein [Yersinia massiliensis]